MVAGSRRLCFSGSVVLGVLALLCLVAPAGAALPDGRGWELVSPVEKNGGQVDPPGSIAGGGVLQAAAAGSAVTYGSRASFAGGAGAPSASQYVSTRGSGGWSTENITAPIFSATYESVEDGAPYQLFSGDLARGLLLNGDHCRGEADGCAVANPPLAGTDAPAGYQNYYLREAGGFEALLGIGDIAGLGLDPASFDLRFAGASPDLRTVVLSSCTALTAAATDACGADQSNLYKWSQGAGALTLVNASPGAELAAPALAVSENGTRIYWRDLSSGDLYLREGAVNTQVDADAGGGGAFQTASADGAIAYFTKAGGLWRYEAATHAASEIATGVAGVLGASVTGSHVYFQDAIGLKLWSGGSTTTVAAGASAADPSTWPPATGAARVSDDASTLLFVSKAQLTGYDNTDKVSGQPDTEVFLYSAPATLICVSCNPAGKRPIGPSTIPGAIANGTAPASTHSYKPRALSANGRRVFFDSGDALVVGDANSKPATGAGVPDVYQWEAQGEGSCTKAGGCIAIISNGPAPEGASFVDASASGAEVYFLTEASLVAADPGSMDIYDARIGGGFPEPSPQIPCEGDACQLLPPEPSDPTVTTLLPGAGNPPVAYRKYCRRGYVKRKGQCVKKGKRHGKRRQRSGGDR